MHNQVEIEGLAYECVKLSLFVKSAANLYELIYLLFKSGLYGLMLIFYSLNSISIENEKLICQSPWIPQHFIDKWMLIKFIF